MTLYEMQQKFGNIVITEGYRSYEEQNAVYNRGSSLVPAGFSYHQYGLAFDIVKLDDEGQPIWDDSNDPYWAACGEIGKKYGFQWGYECKDLINMSTIDGSDYLRQIDLSRKYQPQPESVHENSSRPTWA